MKWHWDHVEWGRLSKYPDVYAYYFYWYSWMGWKRISGIPMVGIYKTWYDGPHVVLRLGPLAISWSTQWTTYEDL